MIGLDAIIGGITGLVGHVLTSWLNLKTLKIKNEHEAKMLELETESMKEEAKMNIAIAKNQIEGEVELADASAYMESMKRSDKMTFSTKWIDYLFNVEGNIGKFLAVPAAICIATSFAFIDWLRGLMRPVLTIYLTGISSVLTYMAWDIVSKHGVQNMTSSQAIDIYNQTTSIIIYLTVSCVTWWFADRRTAKFLQSIYDDSKPFE